MSEPNDPEALLARWADWAQRQFGAPIPDATAAAEAAVDALDAGLSQELAAVAARARLNAWHPADDQLIGNERYRIAVAATDIATLTPRPRLTRTALAELQRVYARRLAAIDAIWAMRPAPAYAPSKLPAASPAATAQPVPAAASTVPVGAAAATVSMREFVTEHGILLLSYLGAFLLVVATLLFEIYGTTGNDGFTRFAAVLVLDIVFGVAGFNLLSRPTLRFVGRSYVALFALLTPLVFAAAYVFLLRPQGLDVNLAVFGAGVSCIVLYGALSVRMESRGYAVMSLVAAPIALIGLFNLLGARAWEGQLLTVLPISMAALPAWRSERWAKLYEPLRKTSIYAYAALSSCWTLFNPDVYSGGGTWTARHLTAGALGLFIAYTLVATRSRRPWFTQVALGEAGLVWIGAAFSLDVGHWTGPVIAIAVFAYAALAGRPALQESLGMAPAWLEGHFHGIALVAVGAAVITMPENGWAVTLTLAAVTAAHALRAYLAKPVLAWTVAIGVTLTVVNLVSTLSVADDIRTLDYAVAALALGALYAAVAWLVPELKLGLFFRAGATIQLLAMTLLPVAPESLRAGLLVLASIIAVMIALDSAEPMWLFASVAIFTVAWYFVVKTLVPPPPNAGVDTLILSYSPLPVIYAVVGMALRRRAGKRWSLAPLTAAAVVAVLVVMGWTTGANFTDAGRALLVYAGLTYVIAMVERRPWLAWPAVVGAALGIFLLMVGASATPAMYPLAFLVVAWVIYAGRFAWEGQGPAAEWRDVHRYAGLAVAVLTAAACFTVPAFFLPGEVGAIASLAALWAAAGMIAYDGRVHGVAVTDYAAALVASAGVFWLSRYAGFENAQAWAAPIGVSLVAEGVLLPRDPRMAAYHENARLVLGVGLALLLGVTAIQTLDVDDIAGNYVALIVAEAAAATVIGVAVRSRVLVLGGAAAAAFGALRALLIVSHLLPLYVVFGIAAFILLAVSAGLAVLRERLSSIRTDASNAWQGWSL